MAPGHVWAEASCGWILSAANGLAISPKKGKPSRQHLARFLDEAALSTRPGFWTCVVETGVMA